VYTDIPCIVREMTDDEAILAMTDDNLRQRTEILPSEKAISLKMQLEAISHQGARDTSGQVGQKQAGERSVDVVAKRNDMSAKQVQRYISLTKLVPEMQKMADDKQLGFTQAVEFSMIKPENQNLIVVSIEGEQAKPSLSQAKRLRELDEKGALNNDVIDGILAEEKKEVDKVIITGAELEKYFGKDKTPREMKDTIMKLLDDMAAKEKDRPDPNKDNAER
jgi:ParB-like chromosome segregation protein Spo0J